MEIDAIDTQAADIDLETDDCIIIVLNEIEIDEIKWSKTQHPPKFIPFVGSPGLKITVSGNQPIDYFNLIASKEFFELIIISTNKALAKLAIDPGIEYNAFTNQKYITEREFRVWLGLLYHTGTIRITRLKDYWKRQHLFNLSVFNRSMTVERFLLILKVLDFSAEADSNKIEPLIDFFNERMNKIYSPDRELTIGSPVVLWRGRLILKQVGKMPKHGIKLHMLNEAHGLTLKIVLSGSLYDVKAAQAKEIVYRLIDGKMDVGHSLYVTDEFSSVNVCETLLERNTYLTGLFKNVRACNLDSVALNRVKDGETVARYTQNGVCVAKWKDRREIHAISSEYTAERSNDTDMPELIFKYDQFMSSDRDTMNYYPCKRKMLPWYKKVGIHLFQMILINSYRLYNKYEKKTMTLYNYRLQIIEKLIDYVSLTPKEAAVVQHYPNFLPKDSRGRTKRKRCRQCYILYRKRVDSIFYCPDCDNQPGLCLDKCFRLYHEQLR